MFRGVKKLLLAVPPVRAVLQARYWRWFATPAAVGACAGVFADFASASAAIPAGAHRGYDTPGAATKYTERMSGIATDDYPALFWVRHALAAGAERVVDFGGHVGLSWYAWREALGATPRWTVCDVPAVVAEGRRLAKERGEDALSFTDDLATGRGSDVLLAQGSLQYVDTTLGALLDAAERPAHVIVSATPTRAAETVWTLQNIGPAICPYAVRNGPAMLAEATARGYSVVASWQSHRTLHVPFHPELSGAAYGGFYLRGVKTTHFSFSAAENEK
jgi:putative methyltransferase (TIGR04325 family)